MVVPPRYDLVEPEADVPRERPDHPALPRRHWDAHEHHHELGLLLLLLFRGLTVMRRVVDGERCDLSGKWRAVEGARRDVPEVAAVLLPRQKPVDVRLLYLHLYRPAALDVKLNCEEKDS